MSQAEKIVELTEVEYFRAINTSLTNLHLY